jgi:hypothetical protein
MTQDIAEVETRYRIVVNAAQAVVIAYRSIYGRYVLEKRIEELRVLLENQGEAR